MSESGQRDIPFDYYEYHPSKLAAIVSGVIFAVLAAAIFFRLVRSKTWWGLVLPIGCTFFSGGFFFRYASAANVESLGAFVLSEMFVVVTPATFLAFNYVLYGRLLKPFTSGRGRYTLINPEKVALIFITSDITTFIIQASGGGLQALDNRSTSNLGRILLLVGIIAQGASYALFYTLLVYSHRSFLHDEKFDALNFPWRILHILHFSSVFIFIRSVYRTVELVGGQGSYLMTHEAYFYALDTIPLFLATVVYAYYWPGDMIGRVGQGYPLLNVRAETP